MADSVNSEAPAPATLLTAIDSAAQTEAGASSLRPHSMRRALVDRMVAPGEWPEPALLEQIVDTGDAAVAPLISVVRTCPRGWPE